MTVFACSTSPRSTGATPLSAGAGSEPESPGPVDHATASTSRDGNELLARSARRALVTPGPQVRGRVGGFTIQPGLADLPFPRLSMDDHRVGVQGPAAGSGCGMAILYPYHPSYF